MSYSINEIKDCNNMPGIGNDDNTIYTYLSDLKLSSDKSHLMTKRSISSNYQNHKNDRQIADIGTNINDRKIQLYGTWVLQNQLLVNLVCKNST